jgi:hypothetical protein
MVVPSTVAVLLVACEQRAEQLQQQLAGRRADVRAMERAGGDEFVGGGLPRPRFELRLAQQSFLVQARVGHGRGTSSRVPVSPVTQADRHVHRCRVPPRGVHAVPGTGFFRATEQMAGWIGAERGRVQPVRGLVVHPVEPSCRLHQVAAAADAGPGRG